MQAVYTGVMKLLEAQLRPYLEIGSGPSPRPGCGADQLEATYHSNTDYSDVSIHEGQITIRNGQIKIRAVNARLSDHYGVQAFAVAHASWKEVRVKIPWRHLASQPVEIQVVGLQVVITPTARADWSVDDVRRHKEHTVADAVVALQKKLGAVFERREQRHKKLGLLGRLKAKLLHHFRPEVTIMDVHVRYENMGQHPQPCEPFAAGLVLYRVAVKTTNVSSSTRPKVCGARRGSTSRPKTTDDRKEVEISVSPGESERSGVYCQTISQGARSVLTGGDTTSVGQLLEAARSVAAAHAAHGCGASSPEEKLGKHERERQQQSFFEAHAAIATRMRCGDAHDEHSAGGAAARRGTGAAGATPPAPFSPYENFGSPWLLGPLSLHAVQSVSTAADDGSIFDYEAPIQVPPLSPPAPPPSPATCRSSLATAPSPLHPAHGRCSRFTCRTLRHTCPTHSSRVCSRPAPSARRMRSGPSTHSRRRSSARSAGPTRTTVAAPREPTGAPRSTPLCTNSRLRARSRRATS